MYTDEELHKMYDEAMRRGDKLLAQAIMTVAVGRDDEAQAELSHLLTMFAGYLVAKNGATKDGREHGQSDLTALDPDAIINL